jgi:hypothetical protein
VTGEAQKKQRYRNDRSLRDDRSDARAHPEMCAPEARIPNSSERHVPKSGEEYASPSLTRRHFVAGVLGMGAAIAAAEGGVMLSGCASPKEQQFEDLVSKGVEDKNIVALDVAPEQIVETTDFEEVSMEDYLKLQATYELPFGCLVHQMSSSSALVLLPGGQGESLRKIAILDLGSGEVTTVINAPVGTGRNMLIYDARASENALIWVELDLGDQTWRVYAAVLNGAAVGEAWMVEEGNADYEPSMLAVAGSKVYWTVMPLATGPANQEDSFLRALELGQGGDTAQGAQNGAAVQSDQGAQSTQASRGTPYTVLTSHGRMITNPLVSDGVVTFVPRVDTENVYYQLTALNCSDDKPVDFTVLPQALRVTEALYMKGSFTFSIEDNYNYARGLSHFGTYQDLGSGTYLHVSRPPLCSSARFQDFLLVKTPVSIVGIDPIGKKVFVIDPPPQSTDYGEVLAGWGIQDRIVTSSIRVTEDGNMEATLVRVFDPIT